MPEIFLSIGSNIDRERNIASALAALERHFGPLVISSLYETEAVGFEGPPFYNLAAAFATDLPVQAVTEILATIEEQHGRARGSAKFSSRTLDIDLILYGDLVVSEDKLKLPRPEITRYAFVLEPLAEIAPDARHPVTGERYGDLWARFDKGGLNQRRVDSPAAPA